MADKDIVSWSMPPIRPIRIPTKSGVYWWNRAKIWFTQSRTFEVYEDWDFPWVFRLNDDTFKDVKLEAVIRIPKGFVFDGASIPRILWPLMNPFGILLIPGLVHDFAYKYDKLYQSPDSQELLSHMGRRFWDQLFRDIAIEVNGMPILNKLAYLGVRAGGWIAWSHHRKNDL